MRKLFLLIAIALLGVASASASPVLGCETYLGANVLGAGFICQDSGLTFSNFVGTDAGGVPNPIVNLSQVSIVGSTVNLTFNPGLDASNGREDIYFSFTVTGALLGVDLTNAGTGLTSIGETVCSGPLSANACLSPNTVLANFTGASQTYTHVTFAHPVSVAYVWKDIFATADNSPGAPPNPGHLSSFTESFDTPVPEPVTFGLIGGGLLLLGLLRRRRS